MDPDHLLIENLARATRAVRRAAIGVKVLCGIAYLFAGGFFLYGLSRIDRGDDIIEFSLLALAIAAIALLFWSMASFHVATVHGMGLLGSLHGKVDALLGALAAGATQANEAAARRAGRARPRPDAPPALDPLAAPGNGPSPEDGAEVSGVMAAPPLPSVPALAPAPPTVAPAAFAAPTAAPPPAEAAEPAPPKAPRPEPTDGVDTKACRTCGSEIRADATRCRWCMKAA